jgi:ElaB/YqjD/DUF883 family membrane-anchored ribosome-binding protein
MTQAIPTNEQNGNGNGNGSMHLDDLADTAKSFAAEAAHTAREKLEAARESVGELATRAADTAGRLSREARGGAMKVGDAVADMVRERPFVALGTAFVAGYITISLLRRR